MTLIEEQAAEIERLEAERDALREENARLREALLFAELMASETGIDPREKCQRIYDELYKIRAAAAAIREGKHD